MEDWSPQDDKNLEEAMRRSKMKGMLADLKKLEGGLPDLEPRDNTTPPIAKQRKLRPWLIAAGILLLLSAGWFLFSKQEPNKYQELFAANFEPYPAMELVRGGEQSLKTRAYEAYATEDYGKASVLLGELHSTTGDTLSLFYLGIAHLGNGAAEKGIESLEKFVDRSDELEEQARLYIVLGHLYIGDVEWLEDVKPGVGDERMRKMLEEVLGE